MKEIVVISGKGGTGKTSLTASFAVLAGDNLVEQLKDYGEIVSMPMEARFMRECRSASYKCLMAENDLRLECENPFEDLKAKVRLRESQSVKVNRPS